LDLSRSDLVLDAGGGTGRFAEAIRENTKQVIVADISIKMLKFTVKKGLPSICSAAEQFPFAEKQFNKIIMMDVFHHLQNHQKVVSELARILQESGSIFILEPDIKKFRIKLIALGEKILLMHSHFYSAKEICRFFEEQKMKTRTVINGINVWIVAKK
jgi:ubiquinone/menaquinone biosynthesis C-methylase UbiE